MHLQLHHTTEYGYSEPVMLAPHMIRLRPRRDPFQQEEAYSLRIDPTPAGISESIDAEGNLFTLAWFTGKTSHLKIKVEATVNLTRVNPYDFVVMDPVELALPLPFHGEPGDPLTPYLHRSQPTREVDAFAHAIADAVNRETIPFLDALSARMHEQFRRQIREQGAPHPPQHTLRTGVGSCRDLAVLFMDACRTCNLPARFVSGYWRGGRSQRHELHAWVEVYLSGGGWRGYDPVAGGAVLDAHLAVAAAASPGNAAPLEGSFFGRATSHMTTTLRLSEL